MISFQFLILLIIIFIIIIIIFNLNNKPNIENYDARITGAPKELCGKICTETFGCSAFAYDDNNSKCYLSERPILFQPGTSLYSNEYEFDHYRCNKVDPIRSDIDTSETITQEKLRKNMIYSCQNEERDAFRFYKIVNNKIEEVDKTNTTDDTRANSFLDVIYEKYPLHEIQWPTQRKDLVLNDLINNDAELLEDYVLFEKDMREYEGDYLYGFQCVKDIPEEDCIRSCKENNDCVGTEFNPVLIKKTIDEFGNPTNKLYHNVCCPKRSIDNIIPRSKVHENGKFYVKRKLNKLRKNRIYIANLNYPLD